VTIKLLERLTQRLTDGPDPRAPVLEQPAEELQSALMEQILTSI
jgi:hypothetical protein